MAKIERTETFVASNGCRVVVDTRGVAEISNHCCEFHKAYWPLDEFEDLVKYVRAHIEEQAATGESKLSELAPEDLVPGGDK